MSVSQSQILKPVKLKNIEYLEVMNEIEGGKSNEDKEDQRQ